MKKCVQGWRKFFSVGLIIFLLLFTVNCKNDEDTLFFFLEALTYLSVPVDDTEVWAMRTNGANKQMLADSDDGETVQQTLSPDGRTLVYVLHSPVGRMVSRNLQTGAVTVLIDNEGTSFDPVPSYSYDGTTIAYAMIHSLTEDGIRVMDPDGTNIRVLTNNANDTTPAYNRSGDRIVFDRGWNGNLFTMNADGTGLVQVTFAAAGVSYGHPQFLPAGRIVCMRNTAGNQDIVVMDADGANEVNLTPGTDTTDEWSPTVSRNGSRIAFATNRNGHNDVYLGTFRNNTLGDLQNLTADVDYDCWRPRFGAVPKTN
jgi:TolB protein